MVFNELGSAPLCTSRLCHGLILHMWGIFHNLQHMVTAERQLALTPFTFSILSHIQQNILLSRKARDLQIKQLHSLKQDGHCPWQLFGPPVYWTVPWARGMREATCCQPSRVSGRWEITCQIYMKYVWKIYDEKFCYWAQVVWTHLL